MEAALCQEQEPLSAPTVIPSASIPSTETAVPPADSVLHELTAVEKDNYPAEFELIDAKKYPYGIPADTELSSAPIPDADIAIPSFDLPAEAVIGATDPAAALDLFDQMELLPAAEKKNGGAIREETRTESAADAEPSAAPASDTGMPSPAYYKVIGELFNSYVLIEQENTVFLMDKHAAHERLLFEEMKKNMLSPDPTSQILLLPEVLPLSPTELAALDEYREEVAAIGFDFTADTDAHTVSLTAIPIELTASVAADLFTEILGRLADGTGSIEVSRAAVYEKALYQASCKAAIKAGRIYPEENIKWLCDRVLSVPNIRYCPHGRPVLIELSKHELERMFKRV